MDGEECESKFMNEVKCISHVVIKEEVIIPDATNDSDSTLSDNEKTPVLRLDECTVCCKYRSMFIILKNHDCQVTETCNQCDFCDEIKHWVNCFKTHKDSHALIKESDESSDSTASDREENEGTCKVCVKYEFMVPLLKSHICRDSDDIDKKCQDCSEVIHWTDCYKKHLETHETKDNIVEIKLENSSDSTTSDSEEIQKMVFTQKKSHTTKCTVCLKYEVMLIILDENHLCDKKSDSECEKCKEIIQWYDCFENHKKAHSLKSENEVINYKKSELMQYSGKYDCRICLKLNSIVTSLVKSHTCYNIKSCPLCQEVSFWLLCLKSHKLSEAKSNVSDVSDGEEFEFVKSPWHKTDCGVCSKFRTTIADLTDHNCQKEKGKQKCDVCQEISFWSKYFKRHESSHLDQTLPLKNFLSCSNCGKRFSGEKMLNVHKSYCKSSLFKCELCNKEFVNMMSLKKHNIFQSCRNQSVVSQNKCKICKNAFSNFLELKKHEKLHENSNSFKCKECFVEFKTEVCLKKHRRIHR